MVRVIDVQQILMQEPRASWKGAQLIAHAGFQQELIRQKAAEEAKRKRTTVQKTKGIKSNRPLSTRTTNKKSSNTKRHIDLKI